MWFRQNLTTPRWNKPYLPHLIFLVTRNKCVVFAVCLWYMTCNKNKWLLPSVKNIKEFKNWPQGSALSVAGGIIIPWLWQSTPSGHYSRAATDPLADRSWAPLSGTQRGAERGKEERGKEGDQLALDLRKGRRSGRRHHSGLTFFWGLARAWKPPIWDSF